MTIYTLGYEGLDSHSFTATLLTEGIQTVVDVREVPISRKPGFSKTALSKLLTELGIAYLHEAALGCPKTVRNQYRVDGDWHRYCRGFLAHLRTQMEAITGLAQQVQTSRCALICFEADFRYCHRTMVADALSAQTNLPVQHLKATTHSATATSSRSLSLA